MIVYIAEGPTPTNPAWELSCATLVGGSEIEMSNFTALKTVIAELEAKRELFLAGHKH